MKLSDFAIILAMLVLAAVVTSRPFGASRQSSTIRVDCSEAGLGTLPAQLFFNAMASTPKESSKDIEFFVGDNTFRLTVRCGINDPSRIKIDSTTLSVRKNEIQIASMPMSLSQLRLEAARLARLSESVGHRPLMGMAFDDEVTLAEAFAPLCALANAGDFFITYYAPRPPPPPRPDTFTSWFEREREAERRRELRDAGNDN